MFLFSFYSCDKVSFAFAHQGLLSQNTHRVFDLYVTCAKKKNCLQRKGRIRYRNYLRFSQWCSTYHPVFYIIIFTDIYVVPPVSLNILLFIKPHGTKVEYVSFVWIFMRHNLNVCLYALVIFSKTSVALRKHKKCVKSRMEFSYCIFH